jgi:hypothetical protein
MKYYDVINVRICCVSCVFFSYLVQVNSLVVESKVSAPLVPMPAAGHDPKPVPPTSRSHNLFPKLHLQTQPRLFQRLQEVPS